MNTQIKEVRAVTPTLLLATTQGGGQYFIKHIYRDLLDIYDYDFIRAQPMTFIQRGLCFVRVTEMGPIDFFEYTSLLPFKTHNIEELEKFARQCFIEDMARQGVLARFT